MFLQTANPGQRAANNLIRIRSYVLREPPGADLHARWCVVWGEKTTAIRLGARHAMSSLEADAFFLSVCASPGQTFAITHFLALIQGMLPPFLFHLAPGPRPMHSTLFPFCSPRTRRSISRPTPGHACSSWATVNSGGRRCRAAKMISVLEPLGGLDIADLLSELLICGNILMLGMFENPPPLCWELFFSSFLMRDREW